MAVQSWVIYSLIIALLSAISNVLSVLIKKTRSDDADDDVVGFMFVLFVTGIISSIYLLLRHPQNTRKFLNRCVMREHMIALIVLSMAVITIVNWLLWTFALRSANNAGLVHSVVNINIVIKIRFRCC